MTYEKDTAPLERPEPPKGGFVNNKNLTILAIAVVGVGAVAAYGFSIQGDDVEEIKVSDVQRANINVADARPSDWRPPADTAADTGANDAGNQDTGRKETGEAKERKRRGAPEGFKVTSPVIMRGGNGMAQVQQAAGEGQHQVRGQQLQQNRAYAGGYDGGGYPGQEGYGEGRRGSNKESFYAGGAAAFANGLDIESELMPEAGGCVVKAGMYIPLQVRSNVRTSLPSKVLAYVPSPVEGNHYLGNGRVERCTAIRPGSTVLSEINAAGVETGDLRIQACALRLDLLGGGRRTLGCQPAHGADGGAGIEAESDYAFSGIATGILIEAALASARGLGGLVAGPAGIAVQVGAGGIADVGSEYVRRELDRPPVLTMKAGAIFGVQLNGDLSFPNY